jgi:hypothetical protein
MANIETHVDQATGLTIPDVYWNCHRYYADIRRRFRVPGNDQRKFHAYFEGFVSQEAANTGKNPVAEKPLIIDGATGEEDAELIDFLATKHLGPDKLTLPQVAYLAAAIKNHFPNATADVTDQTVLDALAEWEALP